LDVVGAQHVVQWERVRGWGHVGQVEGRDVGRVVEDHGELVGEVLDLGFGEREPREPRDMLDVGTREAGRHATSLRAVTILADPEVVVTKPEFLSDDWFSKLDEVVAEFGEAVPGDADLVINVLVTDTPFGAERALHVGARAGRGQWGVGHVPDAEVTITTDYETAKDLVLSGDVQAAGPAAFLAGRVRIQGDLAKLLATQVGGAPAGAGALVEAIQRMTG
jgi:hypothetical protein